jgi:hypothetical protein
MSNALNALFHRLFRLTLRMLERRRHSLCGSSSSTVK